MLFIIFCILLIISIIYLYLHTNTNYKRFLYNELVDFFTIIYICGFAAGLIFHLFIGIYEHTDYNKNDLQFQYEQLEKNKDNPYITENIIEWNKELIFNQKYQKDFWIGPYISNIYDDYKTIEIE